MKSEPAELVNSANEQISLRIAALWAADCAEKSLPIFEKNHPGITLPFEAINAAREYGNGKRRDNQLRTVAMAAFKLGKDLDLASKYVTKAAQLTAAIAYTHTDLNEGIQGIRQARHVLGPAVYAAMALEIANNVDDSASEAIIQFAIDTAPQEVRRIISGMPNQEAKSNRVDELFYKLDLALRR